LHNLRDINFGGRHDLLQKRRRLQLQASSLSLYPSKTVNY
jgi:hypothetical protein